MYEELKGPWKIGQTKTNNVDAEIFDSEDHCVAVVDDHLAELFRRLPDLLRLIAERDPCIAGKCEPKGAEPK